MRVNQKSMYHYGNLWCVCETPPSVFLFSFWNMPPVRGKIYLAGQPPHSCLVFVSIMLQNRKCGFSPVFAVAFLCILNFTAAVKTQSHMFKRFCLITVLIPPATTYPLQEHSPYNCAKEGTINSVYSDFILSLPQIPCQPLTHCRRFRFLSSEISSAVATTNQCKMQKSRTKWFVRGKRTKEHVRLDNNPLL